MTGWEYLFKLHCVLPFTISGEDWRDVGATFLGKVGELEFYADPRGEGMPLVMVWGDLVGSYIDYALPTVEHLLGDLGKLEFEI